MNLLDWIKARRGMIYPGLEYWVNISDITVGEDMKNYGITERRIKRENNYYHSMGLYETRVLLDRNFKLIDGYSTILVAEENGETKVPVNFVDLFKQGNLDED